MEYKKIILAGFMLFAITLYIDLSTKIDTSLENNDKNTDRWHYEYVKTSESNEQLYVENAKLTQENETLKTE